MNRLFMVGAAALGLMAMSAAAQTPPDNTKVNKGDGSQAATTADRSKNDVSDRDIAQKIRKSIVDDSSLSTYAHNVKVITQNGKVTLKGPVRSEDERANVEKKATEVAGAGNVTDQLTIKPKKEK